MLSHTNLLVEFLITGLLVLCAFVLLTFSILPDGMRTSTLQWLASNVSNLDKLLAALILPAISLAYAIGVLSEIATRNLSDRLLATTRLRHLIAFVKDNRSLLVTDPLFEKCVDANSGNVTISDSSLIGEMRFVVMMKSERLSKEIEAQINQLRILRVMSVFLAATSLSLVVLLASRIAGQLTFLVICGLALTLGLLVLDFFAIRNRYQRYCRAVEFSYKALLIDKKKMTTSKRRHRQLSKDRPNPPKKESV